MQRIDKLELHEFSSDELSEICKIPLDTFHSIFPATWQEKSIAVKRFKKSKTADDGKELDDEDDVPRFEKEIGILQLAQRDEEKNIIRIYGQGTYSDSGQTFNCIVMPFFAAGDLYEYIAKNECTAWPFRLSMMTCSVGAINYLHMKGYVHGDIKSPNLMVESEGVVKLIDFETACKADKHIRAESSVLWDAPELTPYNENTFNSDVYSTAVVIWELAAWARPSLLPRQTKNGIRQAIPEDCPPKVAHLITWGWMANPDKRPNIRQVAEELKTIELPALK